MAVPNIMPELRKVLPRLIEARDQNLNEADTVRRLLLLFAEVLGYDRLDDISAEAQMKGKYVDFIIKINGVVRLLVEAKAAASKLRDRHIDQAQGYAARNNYPWVLLTNGIEWILYHLTFDEGIEYERAFHLDLSDKENLKESAAQLAILHKSSVKGGELEEFWNKTSAVAPDSIGKCLFKEAVMRSLRREIRRESDQLIDPEDLVTAIKSMLTAEARELIGPIRLKKSRRKRKRRRKKRTVKRERRKKSDRRKGRARKTSPVPSVAPGGVPTATPTSNGVPPVAPAGEHP